MSTDPPLLLHVTRFFILLFVAQLAGSGLGAAEPSNEELQKAIREAAKFERAERWQEARELYLDLGRSYPTNRNVLYGLERVHRAIDDDGRYLRFLRDNYRRYPGDIVLFKQYIDFSVRVGEKDAIEPDVRLFLTSREPTESTYRTLYTILLPLNLDDLTETILVEGERTLSDSHLFARELSDLYHRTARYEESLEEALNFLVRKPKSLSFVKKRIDSLWGVMPEEEVVRKIEKYSDRQERTAPLMDLQSWIYIRSGDVRKALSVLKELSERNTEAGIAALSGLAAECEARGDFQIGIETYRVLGSLDPRRKVVYDLESARLLHLAGEPKHAGRIYRSVLESAPDSLQKSEIYISLGEIALYNLRQPEEALDWFELAVDEAGDSERSIEARLAMILTLVYIGDLASADAVGARVSLIDSPDDVKTETDYFRGVVALLDGRTDEGREILERVSRRSGHLRANDALEALNWLDKDTRVDRAVSRGLIERKFVSSVEEPDRAIEQLENLREIAGETPLAPDVAYSQAVGFRKAGRYRLAIELLDEIVTMWSTHRIVAQARWEMADIYRNDLGESGMAKTLLEQVILEHGDSVVAPRARRDLEELDGEGEPRS
jgi:tetratricopeptide (TPR) repeat protein